MGYNVSAETELLKSLARCGLIDLQDLQKKAQMKKREEILLSHPFKISQTGNRWRTFLPNEKGKKGREVKKKTKQELEECIISFYKDKEKKNELTFLDCYIEWREYHHKLNGNSENTQAKYNTDYERFLKGTSFESMPIKKITDADIDSFLLDTIISFQGKGKNGGLTYKAFSRLYEYISGTFFRVRQLRIRDDNPMDYIQKKSYKNACADKPAKSADTETIPPEYLRQLMEQIRKDEEKEPVFYPAWACHLCALTGMRVAECAALKWEDIQGDHIYVQRSDKFNRISKTWTIGETKTGKNRAIPIDTCLKDYFDMLKKAHGGNIDSSGYLFPRDGSWTHSNIISSYMKNKCKQLGFKRTYGIHALRKTLNSELRTFCNPLMSCSLLGNSIEVNNNHYTYDMSGMEEKREAIAKAHQGLKLSTV